MSEALSRAEALRVLALSSTADREDVKRAYRRLAREYHPDHGGDPDLFQEVTRAYERLATDDPPPSVTSVVRGRPSRSPFVDAPPTADVADIDWMTTVPTVGETLSRDRLAVSLLRRPAAPVAPVAATSRAPGSWLNRWAPHLADHSTAEFLVLPDRDDRDRPVVALQVRAWSRKGRRVLDGADLLGRWSRIRGSSSTLLRATFPPLEDRRATAATATRLAEEFLEGLGWDLPAWTRTNGTAEG